MSRVFSADTLLNGIVDTSVPVFLDTTSWREFDDWVRQNLPSLQTAIKGGLRFWIFKDELSFTQPKLYARYQEEQNQEDEDEDNEAAEAVEDDVNKLPSVLSFESQMENNLGIKFHEEQLPGNDPTLQTFYYEVQEIYFHDVPNREKCDRHAQFVFLSRRAARSENKVRVLTSQPAFQRLVNADIFLIPASSHKPTFPANFDVFTELQIHPKIRQVVEVDFRNGDYPKVVSQAVNAFRDFVQEITGSTLDGGTLMDEALKLNYQNRQVHRVSQTRDLPLLLLNKISLGDSELNTEVNEQDGFYRFASGVVKAIRNPTAHTTLTDPFIQQRFNDQIAAVKILCFLSMLCERIDQPRRYSP